MNTIVAVADDVSQRIIDIANRHRSLTVEEQRDFCGFGAKMDRANIRMHELDFVGKKTHIVAQGIVRAYRSERRRAPELTLKQTAIIVLTTIYGPRSAEEMVGSRAYTKILAIYR